jgi:hypothetical protein
MEPSIRYFQVNTIPGSVAYGPQIKKTFSPKRENNVRNLTEQNFDRGSENINPAYHRQRHSRSYILGVIEQYPNIYPILAGKLKPPILKLDEILKQK